MNPDILNHPLIDGKIKRLIDCKNILMIGPHSSGKTLTSIKYLIHNFSGRSSLYFTSSSKYEIIENISFINPEMKKNINKNLFIYQAPEPGIQADDRVYSKIILGILNLIIEKKPERIVFDEITPYLAFSDLHFLRTVFNRLIKYLHTNDVNFLFTVAEPVSPRALEVVDILKREFTYYINLSINPILENK